MAGETLVALAAAVVLALTHAFAGRLSALTHTPRSTALSVFGGISVAYVAVHLLPEVATGQDVLAETTQRGMLAVVDRHAYVLTLAGIAVFYVVEVAARRSRQGSAMAGGTLGGDAGGGNAGHRVFAISIGLFAGYNAIIGYLLPGRASHTPAAAVALFTLALAVHFVVNDVGLRDHHRHRYDALGRWILAGAVLAGWAAGAIAEAPESVVVVLTAFLSGGIILNVLKEELPDDRQSRALPFVLGAAVYAALLLAV
jgi:hypothetical protein